MLGTQVSTDLSFDTLPLKTYTPWGLDTFRKGLYDCSADARSCRKRQLPLLAMRANPSISDSLSDALSDLQDKECTDALDECLQPCTDPRMQDTIQQIVWNPSSYGAWLNQKQPVLYTIHTWKTVVLPASAILVPILAIVLPFFILRLTHPASAPPASDYVRTVFASIKHQLSIPAFLKARHANDRIGQGLELLFVLGSVVMFVSGIWSQISAAKHLRTVYSDLSNRGNACAALYSTCAKCVQILRSASPKQQRAFSDLIDAGESALDGAASLAAGGGIAAYGTAWNAPAAIEALRAWIARLDVLVSISRSADICIPTFTSDTSGLDIVGVYHPSLTHSIPNTVALPSHAILTGPNRGGKSTFCRAVTLAVVTAQSWGFAWASRMKLAPFAHILTALDGTGRLGSYSTFEAEIEFAKSVLALPATTRAPVYICMDEIFHSTNARDGVDASRIFLDRLYQFRDGARVSIISTHYRELPEYYGSAEGGCVQCLQAVARMREDDTVEYTYRIKDGVSTVSSVRELLRERGLLCPRPVSA